MLEALKFVMRGVARRDIVPGLTHFRIKDKRVTGYNGTVSLSAPVDVGFDVAPHAGTFIRALNACEDVITLKMESPESLHIRSGAFRISVPCVGVESVPTVKPRGVMLVPNESIFDAFKALHPFVGVDASRPWATGILLAGQSAYATNNVIVCEYWLGSTFPAFTNVPSVAIEEVLKAGQNPNRFQISEDTITFHYPDGRWIHSPLLSLGWPNIKQLFADCWKDVSLQPVKAELVAACEKLTLFGDKDAMHIYFRGSDVSTTAKGISSGGAVFELPDLPEKGCYHSKHLNLVLEAATHADFHSFPEPVKFCHSKMRGVMLGINK